MIPDIRISDFDYNLPDSRIAKYPLPERDSSKLLVYSKGKVSQKVFSELPDLIPESSIMVFNDTKVVPARLHFKRVSGAVIEIFCLKPVSPSDYNLSFASTGRCIWKCIIGNGKRWKDDILDYVIPQGHQTELSSIHLQARLVERHTNSCDVEFTWQSADCFSKVLDLCGQVPIPPYLNRNTESIDLERYQTMYAHNNGSVAAPTAGLHFTESTLSQIRDKGIRIENVCLHVGAGTFLPVKSECISGHPMHREPFIVSLDLLKHLRDKDRKVIAVGTTSVRTLESLYYAGVKCIENGKPEDVDQWDPYTRDYSYSVEESLDALVNYLQDHDLETLSIETRIIIVPGFKFRLTDMLVTNFHQPKSTLLLLISAFVGGDWRTIYDYALDNGFRFLSYGDSSLLTRSDDNI